MHVLAIQIITRLYFSPPIDPRFWPTVGNGHVATVVYSDTVFMNGLYNGNGTESMRARIPAMTAVNIQSISPNGTARLFVLDMKKGTAIVVNVVLDFVLYSTGQLILEV